jgi:hypothetical protein
MHRTTIWSLSILVSLAALLGAGCEKRAQTPTAKWIFENPLREVEAGEWARYVLSDENTYTIEVADASGPGDLVWIQEQTRGSEVNEIRDSSRKQIHRNHVMNGYQSAGWVVQRIYEDPVEVADRRWDALCFEYLTRGHGVVKVWYSHEVPVYGMLKQVVLKPSGQETENAVLVDWSGRSEK